MEEIKKALEALAKAVEKADMVERIKISVTLKKPKTDKAEPRSK